MNTEKKVTDRYNQELEVGDWIVFRDGRYLSSGVIVDFSPKGYPKVLPFYKGNGNGVDFFGHPKVAGMHCSVIKVPPLSDKKPN
jgi:hypothetical protein